MSIWTKLIVTDENKILSCGAYQVAIGKLEKIATPLADDLIESLREDEIKNLMVTFKLNGSNHLVRLNERLTNRQRSLEKVKRELRDIKKGILKTMVENIKDQNSDKHHYQLQKED